MIKQRCVIIDLDGCLSNCDHRRHWVDPAYNEEYEDDFPYSKNWYHKKTEELFKPRWDKFNEEMVNDTPNEFCVELIKSMSYEQYCILYVSGREDKFREITISQIRDWTDTETKVYEQDSVDSKHRLFMRPTGDYRPDTEIKKEIYLRDIEPYYDVLFCVDDRKCVVDMYRSLGLTVLQCAEGEF